MNSRHHSGRRWFGMAMIWCALPLCQWAWAYNYDYIEFTGVVVTSQFFYVSGKEDFSFQVQEAGKEKPWQVISRSPTTYKGWRCGATFTGLKVDWSAKPTIKVVGVRAVDRPEKSSFHGAPIDSNTIVTAHIIWVLTDGQEPKEWHINHWLHDWGPESTPKILRYYADKGPLYDVYGWKHSALCPLDAKSQEIMNAKGSGKGIYHGLIHANTNQAAGYTMELLHLMIGNEVRYGDPSELKLKDKNEPPPEFKP